MRWPMKVQMFLRSLLRRRRLETELDEEMRDHFESEVENNRRAGMTAAEARCAAQRSIGSIALYKDECRDARGTQVFENLARDVRYAIRMLRRTPLFTALAMLTLALGIGANTTVFTFVENILLRSLPVHDPERLVSLNWGGMQNIAYPNYADFRDRNRVFSCLAACRYNPASVSLRSRENFRAWGYEATGNYFEMLGIRPALGRFFSSADDDKPGAHPVVVISYRWWQSAFAADSHVIGRVIRINGFPFTVIGVAPESFIGTELIATSSYWVPMTMELAIEPGNDWWHSRFAQNVWTLGRLKPGVTWTQAEADLNRIAAELARTYPSELDRNARFRLSRPGLIGQALRGPITGFGVVMMSLAAAGLLLACINLAGMLLARASDRQREIGVRLALGAGRWQLLRQLMTESLLLALGGGALGLALAYVACRAFSSWRINFDIPISTALSPDGRVLAFAAATVLLATLLFGLAPALHSMRADLVPSLKNEPVTPRGRKWSVRDLLVAGQIALSVVLVICSVLVVRSLQHALTLNLGFNPRAAVAVSFDLKMQGYSVERSRRFDAEAVRRASAVPGLQAVGLVNNLPLRMGEDNSVITRPDRPVPAPAERRGAVIYNITPGYLTAAGTHLLAGRDVTGQDRAGSPPVVLLNRAAAQFLYPRENPIGRRVRLSIDPADRGLEIVGVVETGKYESIGEDPKPAIFLPVAQTGTGWTTLIARTSLPADQATAMLRNVVLDLDSELTLFNTGSLKEQLALPLFPARIAAVVLGVFGVLAMTLAATGLFALMAYAVARRSREIGIRMALGAQAGQVLTAVFRRTVVLCAIGIAAGTAMTLVAGRLLSAVLYGVSPRDPATYLIAIFLMIAVALLAASHPATRAVRVDPASTLREQ